MKGTSPLNYAFAIGKIRALEKFLIKSEVFEEAIDSSLVEALRLFVESDLYGEALLHVEDGGALEEVLDEESAKVKILIRTLLIEKKLHDLLDSDTLAGCTALLEKTSSGFLKDFARHVIDMHNIKTFLRLYLLDQPQERLRGYLHQEGFIKRGVFYRLYTGELSVFLHHLEYVRTHEGILDYASFLKGAIEKAAKEKNFLYLEKAMNDFLIQSLKPAKYMSFGSEPLLAYYFAKVNEINLIRMIILAKLNNVPTELVKERLNAVYA